MKILVATNNKHKVEEYKKMFTPYGIEVVTPKQLNIDIEPKENGSSYQENSLLKAKAYQPYTSLPILADDSGLNIDSLNGFPGITSSRFADSLGGNRFANLKIIEMLKDFENKSASFSCTITLLNIEDSPLQFSGICPGYVLNAPCGEAGFGYDPIFYSLEAKRCFGVASEDIKNLYSHRAKALRKVIDYLKEKNFI